MNRRRSGVIKGLSWLVIDLCLLASVASVWLAWGVLYPRVDELDTNETFDAIVVLSGEDRRIERGLALAEAGGAPVLVAMYGELWARTRDRCGISMSFETTCPIPPEDSTRGEARLIGELARSNGWRSVLVVSGNYHVSRARLLIKRCVDEKTQLFFEPVIWDDIAVWVRRGEVLKTGWASIFERGC